MTRIILKLERKNDRNSDICIDFFMNYSGTLSSDTSLPNKTIYTLDNGINLSQPRKPISVCYEDKVGDKAKITISGEGFNSEIEVSDTDFIVIEDSTINPPTNNGQGVKAIVIEDSVINPPTGKTSVKITLLSSKEDMSITSTMRNVVVVAG